MKQDLWFIYYTSHIRQTGVGLGSHTDTQGLRLMKTAPTCAIISSAFSFQGPDGKRKVQRSHNLVQR